MIPTSAAREPIQQSRVRHTSRAATVRRRAPVTESMLCFLAVQRYLTCTNMGTLSAGEAPRRVALPSTRTRVANSSRMEDPYNPYAQEPEETVDPCPRPQKLRWLLFEAVAIPILLYGLLALSSWWTVTHLPPGRAFVLEPRGPGRLHDVWMRLFAMACFGLVYVLPALRVRRSIGRVLRLLMAGLFVVFLTWLQAGECVAVVQTPTGYTFVRRIPFGSDNKPFAAIPMVRVHRTDVVTSVHIGDDPLTGLDLHPVYHADKQTGEILAGLLDALAGTGTVIADE